MNRAEAGGSFRDYLAGKQKPFVGVMPYPRARWVDKIATIWPITGDWFYTPAWYLLKDAEYLPSEITQCVQMLPMHFRDLLFVDSDAVTPSALNFTGLYSELIYELADPVSPWALGAMCCAMRRAELAGEVPLFRMCCVGIIWVLDKLISTLDPWVQDPLVKFRAESLARFSSFKYPTPGSWFQLPIYPSELDRFAKGVCEFRKKRDTPFGVVPSIFPD